MPYSLVLRRSRRKKVAPVIGGDPLSDLPELIKENILIRLPVKEAVRTCLLSRSWKEAWIAMPEIVLRDEHCVSVWTDHWKGTNSLEVRQFKKVGDKVLACTKGAIMKFDIASGLDLSKPMDKWIPILVRRKIEHLVIELDWYEIPSAFFSCHSLKHVSLHKCHVVVPNSINGLEKLETLDLNCCEISMKDIERWVVSCPSLRNLTLDSFVLNPDSNLKIQSCSLRIIRFWGCVRKLKLETPNLETACITKFGPSNNVQRGSFVEEFKFLHGLERLEMNHAYMRVILLQYALGT
ncbi:F-box/FBD/LRR-repeat protein [Carex littledalei]|uniref:F-box/FBD/LRR-repeat protein n=1 Tax=Carex littledalei TaxID=544730 RepID=A0A833RJG1_9POAL|nr:F-box/FBD/LRR-repeat protein [Carex littledalei]